MNGLKYWTVLVKNKESLSLVLTKKSITFFHDLSNLYLISSLSLTYRLLSFNYFPLLYSNFRSMKKTDSLQEKYKTDT